MGLTHFPHGIFATPNLGAGRIAGLWTSQIWFVDGRSGADGNPGDEPQNAFKTIAKAVSSCGRDDTIYIRPLNAGVRYTENVVIPAASNADHTKEGISIIGTGNGRTTTRDQSCVWKGVVGVNSPAITANASYGNFENLSFLSVAAQVGLGYSFGLLIRQNSLVFQTGTTGFNIGSTITNCNFIQDQYLSVPADSIVTAIHFAATDGHTVEGCKFMDCRVGLASTGDATGNSCITVQNNLFHGVAASIGADMYMIDVAGLEIIGNIFGHAVPSQACGSGALKKYIKVGGTVTGSLANNFQGDLSVAAGTNNTIGNLICCGNFGLAGPWTS
jgi:hypothetical protein